MNKSGDFALVFECHSGGYVNSEASSGRWWIDGDKLCLEEKGTLFERYREKTPDNCLQIEAGNTYFVARDSFNREIWNFEVFTEPGWLASDSNTRLRWPTSAEVAEDV